jgi:hypothetical protein
VKRAGKVCPVTLTVIQNVMHSFVTRCEEDSTVGFKSITLCDCKFSRGDEKLSSEKNNTYRGRTRTDRQTQIGREVKIPQQSNNAYWKTKDKYSAEGDSMLL